MSEYVPDYAGGTRAADFAWWCDTFLIQTVDQFAGQPLTLESWQRAFFSEALSLDADDRPYWKLVVLVVPRKNGKTAMLAAYSLYHLLENNGAPEALLAASSDKQAGRLFEAGCQFLRANRSLDERVHLREYMGEIARRDGAGKIIRMASDPGRAHGYNSSLVVCDEHSTPGRPPHYGAPGAPSPPVAAPASQRRSSPSPPPAMPANAPAPSSAASSTKTNNAETSHKRPG